MAHQPARRFAPLMLAMACCLLIAACGSTSAAAPTTVPPTTVPPVGTSQVSVGGGASAATSAGSLSAIPEAAKSSDIASPAATSAAPQACSLITEQEAAVALGADPGPGQATALEGTASACTYVAGTSSLQLSLTPTGGKATYDHEQASMPAAAAGVVADISGVGDDAFGQFQGSRAAINFDKGDALVVIGLNVAGATDPPRDQVTVLATAAAGRA